MTSIPFLDMSPPVQAFPVIAMQDVGTFCRPECSCISPTGTISFENPKNALEWGFLPCTTCRPMDLTEKNVAIALLMNDIAASPDFRIQAQELLGRGIHANHIAGHYQSVYGLSFQDYLRMRRINVRIGTVNLSAGQFSSVCPTPHRMVLNRLDTPLGPMVVAGTERGIAMLEFAERRMLETQFLRLEKYYNAELVPGYVGFFADLQKELEDYFAGNLKIFTTPHDVKGTPFNLRVWKELQSVEWGRVCSYKDQAHALGNVKAVRAVARANGENPLGIIVPCHRIIGADGSLTGYGGRVWRKRALLELESHQSTLFT